MSDLPKVTQHGGGGWELAAWSPRSGLCPARPPHPTGARQRQEAHCQADLSSEASDTCRSRGTRSPWGRHSWFGRPVVGPATSTLTPTPRFSTEVKLVGLEGSDKLSILRGCPGLPGAPGPRGEAGAGGLKGMCSGSATGVTEHQLLSNWSPSRAVPPGGLSLGVWGHGICPEPPGTAVPGGGRWPQLLSAHVWECLHGACASRRVIGTGFAVTLGRSSAPHVPGVLAGNRAPGFPPCASEETPGVLSSQAPPGREELGLHPE